MSLRLNTSSPLLQMSYASKKTILEIFDHVRNQIPRIFIKLLNPYNLNLIYSSIYI